MNITFEQSYASRYCNEYDILDNGKLIGYYIEHFHHPLTEEKLDNTVYEIYYDYDVENDDWSINSLDETSEHEMTDEEVMKILETLDKRYFQ